MKIRKCFFVCVMFVGVLGITGVVQALVVDNFDSTPGSVDDIVTGPINFVSGDAIGGSRTLEILSTVGPLGNALDVLAPPGVLSHSQDALTSGSSKVTWDAAGSGLGGLDLTDAGLSTGLVIDLLAIDVGSIDLTFMVMDTGGDSSSLLLPGLVLGSNDFLFTDFVGGADFTAVDVIMLTIDADVASDLTLDLIATVDVPPPTNQVPEPIITALFLIGLGVMSITRRRRM